MTPAEEISLDDLDSIKKVDNNDMLGILNRFPQHVKDAMEIQPVNTGSYKPNLIAILGMGGSAICGDIIEGWLNDSIQIPIIVVRGYGLPKMIDSGSLVFAVSYSGNTEETLSSFEEAVARKANVIAISTGGILAERSRQNGIPHIKISPKEALTPRAAIAYLLFPLVSTLIEMGIISRKDIEAELNDVTQVLDSLSTKLSAGSGLDDNFAKQIAVKIKGHVPVISSYRPFSCIAYRWRTQLNENSKVLAINTELPELNHNDIVGWVGDDNPDRYCVILLRDDTLENPRIKKRIDLTMDLAFSKAGELIEVHAEGKYKLSKMLSLMYVGDFTSVYLAILRGIDPTPVEIIDKLKKRMAD
jgi:glucose/mannose-6-phosphate isomerase